MPVKIAGSRVAVTGACARLGAASAAYTCDLGVYDAVVAVAERIEAEQGPVDVLVNNAGVGVAGPFLEHSIEDPGGGCARSTSTASCTARMSSAGRWWSAGGGTWSTSPRWPATGRTVAWPTT